MWAYWHSLSVGSAKPVSRRMKIRLTHIACNIPHTNHNGFGKKGFSVQICCFNSGTFFVLLYLIIQFRFADFTDKQKKTILQKCSATMWQCKFNEKFWKNVQMSRIFLNDRFTFAKIQKGNEIKGIKSIHFHPLALRVGGFRQKYFVYLDKNTFLSGLYNFQKRKRSVSGMKLKNTASRKNKIYNKKPLYRHCVPTGYMSCSVYASKLSTRNMTFSLVSNRFETIQLKKKVLRCTPEKNRSAMLAQQKA